MKSQQNGPRSLAFNPGAWSPLGPSPLSNGVVYGGSAAVSGRATAFVINPTNTNILYLGTANGGVYRSTNGGASWTAIFDTANTSAIGTLALSPVNPSTLYVGTGEANSGNTSTTIFYANDQYYGTGLFRIDNADTTATVVGPINPTRTFTATATGTSFTIPIFFGRTITSIVPHPSDPSIVYVGTGSGFMGIGGEGAYGNNATVGTPPLPVRGLYKLTGANGPAASVVQTKLSICAATCTGGAADSPNTGNLAVTSMALDPTDPEKLLVYIAGGTGAGTGGLWITSNLQTGAPPTFTQGYQTTTNLSRGELSVYKDGSNLVVYMATMEGTPPSQGLLRRSTTGGVTGSFTQLTAANFFCERQCAFNFAMTAFPGPTSATTDDIIYLGGNVVTATARVFAESTNGGTSFTEKSTGLHYGAHFIKVDPTNPLVIYHGNDGGVFKTTNGGTSWTNLNTGLNTLLFNSLAVHPTDANFTLGGLQDNGTALRSGAGTWTRVDTGLTTGTLSISTQQSQGGTTLIDRNATNTSSVTLYHGYPVVPLTAITFGRVLSTTCAVDGGWTVKGGAAVSGIPATPRCDGTDGTNGIDSNEQALLHPPMELGPGNPNTLYLGASSLWRSADRGDTMVAVSQNPTNATGQVITAIGVSPQDDNYRFIGRRDGTLYYTTTGANPMTQLTGTLIPARYVARVKFDPTNKNTVFIALGGFMGQIGATPALANPFHVWKVTNLDTTPVATAISGGLPDVPVNAMAIDPANSNRMYIGTDTGVYATEDGGTNWEPYGTGLPVVPVWGAEIQPSSRILRIATHGRGVWEAPIAPLVVNATVTNVTSSTANGTYGVGAPISIQVTFSSAVTVTGTPTLALNSGGTASYTSGSGTSTLTFTYTVAGGQNSADLDYTSTGALTGTITTATLTLPAPGAAGSLGFNKAIVIDTAAKTVTNVSSSTANGTYGVGGVVSIQVTFSGTVTVTGTPTLALNSGGTASYTSGSGTNTLNFTYTVAGGENSADLDYSSVNALTGTITTATLTLPAPGAAGSLGFNKAIVIDTVKPTVVSYEVLFGSKTFNLTGSTRVRLPWQVTGIRVTFSEPVTATLGGLTGAGATSVSGSGTAAITWSIASVTNATLSTALQATIADLAGNTLTSVNQTVKVLQGDTNDDGTVNSADVVLVNQGRTQAYNVLRDIDGSNVVDTADVNIVRAKVGQVNP